MSDRPRAVAIMAPSRRKAGQSWTFERLAEASDRLAVAMLAMGIGPGCRVAMMAPPSPTLFAALFGLFRIGAVAVMVDPGMGLAGLRKCLGEADCHAFIGSPKAIIARWALGLCPRARFVASLGAGWVPGCRALREAAAGGSPSHPAGPGDTAAILYTSGSTGPAKGAVYSAGNLAAQVSALGSMLDIVPGETDLSTFPLFGLYAPVLRMTAVIPPMDFTRPASVDAGMLLDLAARHRVDNLFASPAVLARLAAGAESRGGLSGLKRLVSAGAPVPWTLVRRVRPLLRPDARLHTPYGMTEALPVACASDREILGEALEVTRAGRGICLGRPAPGTRVMILPEGGATGMDSQQALAHGGRGEIAVAGPQVTRAYWNRPKADERHKIILNGEVVHRTGDLGWLDEGGMLWYLGRQAQVVSVAGRAIPADATEAMFLDLPGVARAALVACGKGRAALVLEPAPGAPDTMAAKALERATKAGLPISCVMVHPRFPVDRRHNSKIERETLAAWAAAKL